MPAWVLVFTGLLGHFLSLYARDGRLGWGLGPAMAPLILRSNAGYSLLVILGAALKIGSALWLLVQGHWVLAPSAFFLAPILAVVIVRWTFSGETLYGLLAGSAGGVVCFGIGFLIVKTVGVPEGASFGVGLEPWNVPGTILGAAIFVGLMVRRFKKGRK